MANVDTPARRGPLARLLAGALLVAAVFALLQAADYKLDQPSNDTYQYARQTLRFLGDDQATAVRLSTEMYCHDSSNAKLAVEALENAGEKAAATAGSRYQVCLNANPDGLSPLSPRYIAIFTSRPGYPLLSVPFVAVLGLRAGLWVTALLSTLLGGLLVAAILRSVDCPPSLCLVGDAFYLAAPTGYWGTRMLTDGPSLAASLLAVLGALWLIQGGRRRTPWGAAALVAGLAADLVIRYSSETPLAALLALAAGLLLWRAPGTRHRGTVAVAGIGAAAVAVTFGLSALLRWPSFSDSLQDTFTGHFAKPDVADPLHMLLRLDYKYWTGFPASESTALLLGAGAVAVAVALWRLDRVLAALAVALSATGVAALVVHPVANQADRLIAPAWTVIALGLPVLLARARRPVPPPAAPPEAPSGESVVYAAESA